MFKRILLILVALVLLLAVALLALRFLGRRAAEPSPSPEAVSGTGLPEAGAREVPLPTPPAPPLSPVCPANWPGLPDGDNDGLPDEVEALYLTDEKNPDTDGDGHSDSDEIRAGFDPLKSAGNPVLDSDNDGLRDHDECAWKTDPFTADTDGDGFPDGAEVENGFDPTKRGDGRGSDALPERRAQDAEAALDQFRPRVESENLTESIAARLFGDRPLENLATFTPSAEEVARIINELPANTNLPSLSVGEITVASSNTAADINGYLAELTRVIPRDFGDASAIAQAIEMALSGQPERLRALAARLRQYAADLQSLATPPSAVQHHLHLLAMTRFTESRLQIISEFATTDPVRAYVAVRELQEGVPQHNVQLKILRKELERLAGRSE